LKNTIHSFPLKNETTFGISAFADEYIAIESVQEAKDFFSIPTTKPFYILGGGSNILITKEVNGVIVQNKIKGKSVQLIDDFTAHVTAGAGENWNEFVLYCIENNWGGLENLSLIPGNVGASPMQNIGAYGVEIKDVFVSLNALEIATNKIHSFDNETCKFGYRESIFKNTHKNKFLIIDVTFKLSRKNHKISANYGAIQSELKNNNIQTPTIKDISNAVIAIRSSKLPDPKLIGNAGSFFKNPVISISLSNSIKTNYPDLVEYPVDEKSTKLAAGWLIEKAGWKGFRQSDAGVHTLQALVLVNYGNATGNEILDLSQKIMDDVFLKFGVLLEREVNIW
jgi:UDP-N-acetylmuramate dehydrogenase